jgi:hypothetical protein
LPDLNPRKFYFGGGGGELKVKVYVNNPKTHTTEIKHNILVEISHIAREERRRVAEAFLQMCEARFQAQGCHIVIPL